MKITRIASAFAVVALVFSLLPALAQNRLDAEFQKFWAARSPNEAERLVEGILKTGITFDEALQRLMHGRTYTAQPTGVIKLSNRTVDGVDHNYALNIPPSYDPAKRYQVRYQLHGGVGGRIDNKPRGTGEIGALAGAEQIYVIPYSWADEPWWSDDQVLNLNAILDSLKRTYNVDENRVVVAGVSDGGTGAYYIAMRETTPFASFLPLNGFAMVLASDEIDDGGVFPNNLLNKPLFVINGGRDPLYPTSHVEPFVMHFKDSGVETAYYPQPEAGHNTAWWPEMKDTFEQFVADHPRNPDPDKLTWETVTAAHNRAHWLVIDELGKQPGDKPMPDINVAGNIPLFFRKKAPGRVALVRTGNTIQATTENVAAFTLLLSPGKFDFSQPIKVVANGREVFNKRVERSVKTMMQWAARDNDRTMLYAAELKIKLAR
jgi:predicted esterase